jgi:hypothetical protein
MTMKTTGTAMMTDGALAMTAKVPVAMVTVMAAADAKRRAGGADEVPGGRGRGVVVVALIVPPHPSPGDYLAPNPTVGIGA